MLISCARTLTFFSLFYCTCKKSTTDISWIYILGSNNPKKILEIYFLIGFELFKLVKVTDWVQRIKKNIFGKYNTSWVMYGFLKRLVYFFSRETNGEDLREISYSFSRERFSENSLKNLTWESQVFLGILRIWEFSQESDMRILLYSQEISSLRNLMLL